MTVVISLPPTTVGAHDTIIPIVLSAPVIVMRDKTRPRRYVQHFGQIRNDRCRQYDRQGRCAIQEPQAANRAAITRTNRMIGKALEQKAPAILLCGLGDLCVRLLPDQGCRGGLLTQTHLSQFSHNSDGGLDERFHSDNLAASADRVHVPQAKKTLSAVFTSSQSRSAGFTKSSID